MQWAVDEEEHMGERIGTGERSRDTSPGELTTVELSTEIRGRKVSCRWSPAGVTGDPELLARIARAAGSDAWRRSASALATAMQRAVPGPVLAKVRGESGTAPPTDGDRGGGRVARPGPDRARPGGRGPGPGRLLRPDPSTTLIGA